jgi:hypothetical protein
MFDSFGSFLQVRTWKLPLRGGFRRSSARRRDRAPCCFEQLEERVVPAGGVGQDQFLQGKYIEVGINSAGSFGSQANAPAGYHPASGSESNQLGIVWDFNRNGWAPTPAEILAGIPGQSSDAVLPGTPEEGWAIRWDSTADGTQLFDNFGLDSLAADVPVPTASLVESNSLAAQQAVWSGTASTALDSLAVTQTYQVQQDNPWVTVNVVLTNRGSSTLRDVEYLRNLDPDPEAAFSSDFNTNNIIVAEPTAFDSAALVLGEGTEWGITIGLGAEDPRATVYSGGFFNRDPSALLANQGGQYLSTAGQSEIADSAISLVFQLDTLKPGASTYFSFVYLATNPVPSPSSELNDLAKALTTVPITHSDSYSIGENGALVASAVDGVLANDIAPPAATLQVIQATEPAHGSLTWKADGSFVYKPSPGFVGMDSFSYTASDGVDSSEPTLVTLSVDPVYTDTLPRSQPFVIDVADLLADETDLPEGGTAPLHLTSIGTSGTDGTVVYDSTSSIAHPEGTLNYTPSQAFVGTDSFTIDIADSTSPIALTATATVQVNVAPPLEQPPVGADITGNGVTLGIDAYGDLNFGAGAGLTGLVYAGQDGIDPQGPQGPLTSPFEGWGVAAVYDGADAASPVGTVKGYVDRGADGAVDLSQPSFTSDGTTATSVVDVLGTDSSPVLQVEQNFAPAPSSDGSLFEDTVTIANLGDQAIADLLYRRVIDFPGAVVALTPGNSPERLDSSKDGAASADPTSVFTAAGQTQGALFDFDLGALSADGVVRFTIWYGGVSGVGKDTPQNDLFEIQADAYALAAIGSANDDSTYLLAFAGLGGSTIVAAPPQQTTVPAGSTGVVSSSSGSVTVALNNAGGANPVSVQVVDYSTCPTPIEATLPGQGAGNTVQTTYVDVLLQGASANDSLTVYFPLPADYNGGTIKVHFWDTLQSQWDSVSAEVVGDEVAVTITGSTTLSITELSGTVFAINVVVPNTSTTPVTPPVAALPSFEIDVTTAARLITSSQVTLTVQSSQASQATPATPQSGLLPSSDVSGGGLMMDPAFRDFLSENPDLFWFWLENTMRSEPKQDEELVRQLLPPMVPEVSCPFDEALILRSPAVGCHGMVLESRAGAPVMQDRPTNQSMELGADFNGFAQASDPPAASVLSSLAIIELQLAESTQRRNPSEKDREYAARRARRIKTVMLPP